MRRFKGMKRCKKYTELFSNTDIATEILSRLPVKSLMAFKCTSKRWYTFVSDPLFLRIHFQRSEEITLLVLQNMKLEKSSIVPEYDSVDLLTPTETGYALNCNSLDFLPEKVIVLSSSHGILCCRSWVNDHLRSSQKETVTYICNPITRTWVQFRSNVEECDMVTIPGFAFYPTFSSSSSSGMFKLVRIFYNEECWSYLFDIYSSDTNKWKRSEAVCKTQQLVCPVRSFNHPPRVVFANGWFHWWTTNHKIIAFHVEKELCKLIELPFSPTNSFATNQSGYMCWGESEGYFHYVYAFGPQLQVWVLKNYNDEEEEEKPKPAWELKYCLDMVRFCYQHPSLHKTTVQVLNVLTFHEDVLYIKPFLLPWEDNVGNLVSYDFRTKTLIDHGQLVRQSEKDPDSTIVFPFHHEQYCCPLAIPFTASLLPLQGARRRSLLPKQGLRRSKRLEKTNTHCR